MTRFLLTLLALTFLSCNNPNDYITDEINKAFRNFNTDIGLRRDQIIQKRGIPQLESQYNEIKGMIMQYDLGEVQAQLLLNKDLIAETLLVFKTEYGKKE